MWARRRRPLKDHPYLRAGLRCHRCGRDGRGKHDCSGCYSASYVDGTPLDPATKFGCAVKECPHFKPGPVTEEKKAILSPEEKRKYKREWREMVMTKMWSGLPSMKFEPPPRPGGDDDWTPEENERATHEMKVWIAMTTLAKLAKVQLPDNFIEKFDPEDSKEMKELMAVFTPGDLTKFKPECKEFLPRGDSLETIYVVRQYVRAGATVYRRSVSTPGQLVIDPKFLCKVGRVPEKQIRDSPHGLIV